MEPVFSLVEDFRHEDQVGTVLGCRFNVNTSQFDVVGVHELRFWVDRESTSADVGDGGEERWSQVG